jgi:hypothetical protein
MSLVMDKSDAILEFEKNNGVTISLSHLGYGVFGVSTSGFNSHSFYGQTDWDVIAFGCCSVLWTGGDVFSDITKLLSGWELRKDFMDMAFQHVIEYCGDYISKLMVVGDRYKVTVFYHYEVPVLVDRMVKIGLVSNLGGKKYELMFPVDGLREFIALLA